MKKIEIDYNGKKLSLETGKIAKQANGSVMVSYGDTRVLVTSTAENGGENSFDFFPLTCVYQVKTYSQGRILGGFVKRERNPSEHETLASRMIDRPLRPLFEEGFSEETQVIATVVSYDMEASPAAAAMLGASASLLISDIPYKIPVAGINVGRIDGEFIVNPSPTQLEESDLDLFMVAKKEAIVMVEAGCKMVSEEVLADALRFGHEAILPLIDLQEKLLKEAGKPKREVKKPKDLSALLKKVTSEADKKMKKALTVQDKILRKEELSKIKRELLEKLITEDGEFTKKDISTVLDDMEKKIIREDIVKKGRRIDGRKCDEIRPITCEVGLLPNAHGSALFTRGETQALVVTTLGTKDGEQMVDDPLGLYFKRFYLHYNFPAYSVGEVRRLGPPGRREIGHGNLAERGLMNVLPKKENFPYTIRIVSEITESNGSSSMASVCGGSLSLMDAGVPTSEPVAGVAMGLVQEGKQTIVLSDILGDEDHVGDMDFKVVGTREGITALQMDIKLDGLSQETIQKALAQAKTGRLHILDEMEKSIETARDNIAPHAPRFIQHKIPADKIRDIIGPGGKIIKSIQAETGAKIEIEDSGMVSISSSDQTSAESALALIRELTQEVEIGVDYEGVVKKIVDFGAFVEILPNTQGLVHISEISSDRVNKVEDVLKEEQTVMVKAIGRDKRGKLKLSIKATEGN